MRVNELPRTVLMLEYRIARAPLQYVKDHVVSRMSARAPGRLAYEHWVGALDVVVGRALGADDVADRGAVAATRATALMQAAHADVEAAEQSARAAARLREGSTRYR